MCRMFAYLGSNRAFFMPIHESLREVCVNDPLSNLISKPFMDHRDGWGLVQYSIDSIRHERFSNAIFRDPAPVFTGDFIVIHARNAAPGQPFGMLNAHPHMRASEGYDLYLAHNGELDKARIRHGLSDMEIENRTDSEVFLDLMASFRGSPTEVFEQAIREVYDKAALISGLVLFLVSVDRKDNSGKLMIYSDAANFNDYHRLYYFEGDGWKTVVSSSIPLSKKFPSWLNKESLKAGSIYSLSSEGLKVESVIVKKE